MADVAKHPEQPQDAQASPQAGRARMRRAPRMRMINAVAIIIAAILSLIAVRNVTNILATASLTADADQVFEESMDAAMDLQRASDYLTTQARMYVTTGDRSFLDNYIRELRVRDQRGEALKTVKANVDVGGEQSVKELQEAYDLSEELARQELYHMHLAASSWDASDLPTSVTEQELSAADEALSPEQKRSKATRFMLGDKHLGYRNEIGKGVRRCTNALLVGLQTKRDAVLGQLRQQLNTMQAVVLTILVILVLVIVAVIFLILWPVASFASDVERDEPLTDSGARELSILVRAYNEMYRENHERTARLQHAAERDPLTGLLNRGAYDTLLAERQDRLALLLLDVDLFKEVNDSYGHDLGDAVLRKVASSLTQSFRSTDYACRIGGDEFAVIMTDVDEDVRPVIERKIRSVTELLQDTRDGLPAITLSIGVALSEQVEDSTHLYRAADKALYAVKRDGRSGYRFYEE